MLKFRCKDCSKVFEELVFGGRIQAACPDCGSKMVERHYQGKCYFGATSSSGGSSCSGGNCSTCSGCGRH